MSFGIYVSLVIWITVPNLKSQNTVLQIKRNCEAQLSEMNVRMQTLEKTLDSFVTDNQNQIEDLKSTLNAQLYCERNKSSVYTIEYTLKNWMDADLSCKANGSHLVSYESVDEHNHVFGYWLLDSCQGFRK